MAMSLLIRHIYYSLFNSMTRPLKMGIKEASYRSFVDVVEYILEAAIGGLERVHVMHECNLTQNQLQAYLDLLLQEGLVKMVEPSLRIQTTEKGLAFMNDYNELKKLIANRRGSE